MKKCALIIIFSLLFSAMDFIPASAQCSICAKTAQQMGPGPARGLNSGILYLAFTPFAIVGLIGYRWWKREKVISREDAAT
jgi:hypothetical protein